MSDITNEAGRRTISAMGGEGGIVLTDTSAITGTFRAVVALTDCIFTTLTMPGFTTNDHVTASVGSDFGTLPVGESILGHITACTLASGTAILYK